MHLSAKQKTERLSEFARWCATYIEGYERGEAQIFLDRFFTALGWPGLKEAGASCELRVAKDSGGTAFADLVWKPVVLIEMKKRGTDLAKHYRQAFDYWARLVPNRPRYTILCNFDEFWVYDFETQMDVPVDRVTIEQLPERYGPIAFMFPGHEAPVFGNDQEAVTRQAADRLAECFNSLTGRGIPESTAQRFTLQTMMCLFAEDIGLIDRYFFTRLLDEIERPEESFDLIGGLFDSMNVPDGTYGGRFKGVPYFNGGLFSEPAKIELVEDEVALLRIAAKFDWSMVRPEIFGTLFEHSMGKSRRHAEGAYFTNAVDIMKIVTPTIVEPWRDAIARASTLMELRKLLARIEKLTVLDPACGSGNFLYIAYRELKRLEATIYDRMANEYKSVNPHQRPLSFLSAANFFGIDINPFAVEIAKVTMMLAHKLTIDELAINEPALPLNNLDRNFVAEDALIQTDGSNTPWPKVDVIIGNPPFLGAKRLKPERGDEYVTRVRNAYPAVPGMADYCVFWLRRAHDELSDCTAADPFAGRAGLVGTQNVRNNASRIGGLDHIAQTGTIVDAVDNQPWSGEAAVNVAIVNWVKTKSPALLPVKRRLWTVVPGSEKRMASKKGAPKTRRYELSVRETGFISSSLSDRTDVSGAARLPCNEHPQIAFQGMTPGYAGFVLSKAAATDMITADPTSAALIKPYLIGRELAGGDGLPQRFIIDLFGLDAAQLPAYPRILQHLRNSVLPAVTKKLDDEKAKRSDMVGAREEHLQRWWTFWAQRLELRRWMVNHDRILAASRTQRLPFIFEFIPTSIVPGDKLQLFALDDDYSFGVLQSGWHSEWYSAKGARLKNEADVNYSSDSVFATFPWPQKPSSEAIALVEQAANAVRQVRADLKAGGIKDFRSMYATLGLPGRNRLKDAHEALDVAVRSAYGFKSGGDRLAQLLTLNASVAKEISAGAEVTGPGRPTKI